jgi:hypothetical protein
LAQERVGIRRYVFILLDGIEITQLIRTRVMIRITLPQRARATDTVSYAVYRFPPDAISYSVWLYYRFPMSLRMVQAC